MTPRAESPSTIAIIVGGLVTSAIGIGVVWATGHLSPTVPGGIVLLLGAAVLVAAAPRRWAPLAGTCFGLYVTVGFVVNGRVYEVIGHDGVGVALGRSIQLAGVLAAVTAGAWGVLARARVSAGRHIAQVLGLLLLAPVCAEYLAAYDDSTGDPVRLLAGLAFFSPLYGCPALVIREVTRRTNRGWTCMVLLATAFGLVQAGVVDQSLFSISYRDIDSWETTRQSTLIASLRVSAHMIQAFVGGHVIYSICAPIALVEAFGRDDAGEPWLGRGGLAVTAILYVTASALVLADHLSSQASHASPTQVTGALLVACGLVAGAFLVQRPRRTTDRRVPRPGTTFVVSLVAAGALTLAPESWSGVALATGVLSLSAVLLVAMVVVSTLAARQAGSQGRESVGGSL
ncbi:MAG: hypothetical protein JJE40_00205 [Vicinamibacteria bacterium]|nr:hypothetical protein [Vicinamibacteria bacterium]